MLDSNLTRFTKVYLDNNNSFFYNQISSRLVIPFISPFILIVPHLLDQFAKQMTYFAAALVSPNSKIFKTIYNHELASPLNLLMAPNTYFVRHGVLFFSSLISPSAGNDVAQIFVPTSKSSPASIDLPSQQERILCIVSGILYLFSIPILSAANTAMHLLQWNFTLAKEEFMNTVYLGNIPQNLYNGIILDKKDARHAILDLSFSYLSQEDVLKGEKLARTNIRTIIENIKKLGPVRVEQAREDILIHRKWRIYEKLAKMNIATFKDYENMDDIVIGREIDGIDYKNAKIGDIRVEDNDPEFIQKKAEIERDILTTYDWDPSTGIVSVNDNLTEIVPVNDEKYKIFARLRNGCYEINGSGKYKFDSHVLSAMQEIFDDWKTYDKSTYSIWFEKYKDILL